MSVESAKAFIKRAVEDEDFGKKVLDLKDEAARLGFAKAEGYDFSQEDVEKLLPAGVTIEQLRALQGSDELPDEVMEAVVGGKSGDDWAAFGIGLAIEVAVALI
jgi:predicted ribosomally synthesized peptide with nif11-like leader